AQRGEAFLGTATLHFVQKRIEDASSRSADRMTDGGGAVVYGALVGAPAEPLIHSERLGGESFVGLDQIEILDRPAGFLERLLGSRNRSGTHDRRITTGGCP